MITLSGAACSPSRRQRTSPNSYTYSLKQQRLCMHPRMLGNHPSHCPRSNTASGRRKRRCCAPHLSHSSPARCSTARRRHGCITISQPHVTLLGCGRLIELPGCNMFTHGSAHLPQDMALQDTPTSPRTDVPPLSKRLAPQQQGPALRGRGDDLPALTGGQLGTWGMGRVPCSRHACSGNTVHEGGVGQPAHGSAFWGASKHTQ